MPTRDAINGAFPSVTVVPPMAWANANGGTKARIAAPKIGRLRTTNADATKARVKSVRARRGRAPA